MREYLESLLLIIKEALFSFFLKCTYHTIKDSRFTMEMYCRLVVDMDVNVLKKINIYIPKYILLKINNIILNEYRDKTHDIFLTSFKGLRKDGVYRRRIDFRTVKCIMNKAIKLY